MVPRREESASRPQPRRPRPRRAISHSARHRRRASAPVTRGCSATRWARAAWPSRPAPWSSCSPATASSSAAATSTRTTRSRCACSRATRRRTSRPEPGTIAARFERAAELRRQLLGAALPQAMRVFAGESEGLPGVTVDRYGDFVVVQWLSGGRAALARRAVRRDRGDAGSRAASTSSGGCARSPAARRPSPPCARAARRRRSSSCVEDGGCRFGVDVTAPLGVGLFPDMRLGWAAVAARAAGRRVLNLFSYTGAFSVHAAKAGAAEVVAVDTAAEGARARAPQLRAVRPRRRAPRDADRGRDQDARAVRVARALVRHRRLRPADVLARPAGQFSVARDLAQAGRRERGGAGAGRVARVRHQLDQGLGGRARPRAGRGRRRRARRAADLRARRPAAGLPGRARLSRGQLPQGRARDPRA